MVNHREVLLHVVVVYCKYPLSWLSDALCSDARVHIFVYDKCAARREDPTKRLPTSCRATVTHEAADNDGRDFNVYIRHVLRHYARAPGSRSGREGWLSRSLSSRPLPHQIA